MATLIPTLGAARFDARGELRLAERLKDCLEDNASTKKVSIAINSQTSNCSNVFPKALAIFSRVDFLPLFRFLL